MKPLYLLIPIYIGFCLSGCATIGHSQPTTPLNKGPLALNSPKPPVNTVEKDPASIAMYTEHQQPSNPYKVLGTETVSKFNYGGIKRQMASIHDAMRDLAAKMGGDAVINIAHDDKTVTGTVISYQDSKPQKASV